MTYILVQDGIAAAWPYSFAQLRADNPETIFASAPTEETLAAFGVHVVREVAPPAATETQRVLAVDPAFSDGEWRQTWTVEDIPIEELRAAIAPVSPRQARLALFGAGLLAGAEAALAALPEPQRSAALIEWEYTPSFRRDHTLIAGIGTALGLAEEQIDDLFRAAAAL